MTGKGTTSTHTQCRSDTALSAPVTAYLFPPAANSKLTSNAFVHFKASQHQTQWQRLRKHHTALERVLRRRSRSTREKTKRSTSSPEVYTYTVGGEVEAGPTETKTKGKQLCRLTIELQVKLLTVRE